ncbi:hypothetical protein [Rathayibacter tanaceti]|uniref:Peptidase inhibitor family I36 n=2 Tax=Rathayibacter tanaceti TaxID=1671680 RepID=A0A162GSV4_9MICO|nr:hypothetical protein [Rathayibacter tanaceti]KZX22128.1 hypothetical protein ACH61_00695 [Rathayibacter tanaceti]QHC54482.1 hypothetical protein GSU10_01600 [Rathayibacter tanaceti]TCO35026.1 hypothetical protein EV639_10930 [Rathayibacter tanaceti]
MSVRTLVTSIARVTAATALAAAPARADSSNEAAGCSLTTSTPYRTTDLRLGAWGRADRDTSADRSLSVQVWHYDDYLPDALVFTSTDAEDGSHVFTSNEQCDSGGDTTYFASGDVNGGGGTIVTTGDTDRIVFSHC